jgi:predicted alpha-1,2-mannosidase
MKHTIIKTLRPYILAILIVGTFSCQNHEQPADSRLDFVDPFIGTDFHGHTFPGATTPHGLVQLSPDTRTLGWDACAGYHFSDSSILGFSHTHLSGTGIGDYGDVLFMPFSGDIALNSGVAEDPDSGFRSRFDRATEAASPGYYMVELTDDDIQVELTATPRVGIHRYHYTKGERAGVLIDLTHTIHGHRNPIHEIKIINDREIHGLKVTSGWAKNHIVYFAARFSEPFETEIFMGDQRVKDLHSVKGKDLKVKLLFSNDNVEELIAKVGISPVSFEGAAKNLDTEAPGWDFDAYRKDAEAMWEDKLSLIDIETDNLSDKRTFYTALYHTMIFPGVNSDVDGKYRSMRQEVVHSDNPNYTVFSLWDTYRALHPLFTIIQPEYNQELIQALLRKYDEGGILPMWELASNYTGTMIGSHAVSVIVDAYMKGYRDFDTKKALEAIVHSVKYDTVKDISYSSDAAHGNLMPKAKLYEEQYGFVPSDLEHASVSKALEFAYNYWAIATMAEDMGEAAIAREFYEKSKRYEIYFDKEVGFMRGKRLDGSWDEPFDPRFSAHWKTPYVEGNAWQWTWFVPHDVEGFIDLFGGKEAFATKLDSLFTVSSEVLGEEKSADITGLIGQYAHGNEPSHHIAYLFNWVERPWRTQEIVSQILNEFYTDQPDGLCGNEDCGQMSAWYILNSLGFYPVSPGDPRYSIGRPSFNKTVIALPGDSKFTIIADELSEENKYVQAVYLNGEKLTEPFIDHSSIKKGGTLRFVMGQDKTVFWKE